MINITVSHEDWDLVCRFGANEPKIISKSTCQIFTNKTSFYSKLYDFFFFENLSHMGTGTYLVFWGII